MAISTRCLTFFGLLVGFYCLSLSMGKDVHRHSKRSPDSLYDNIYSAISEFKQQQKSKQQQGLPADLSGSASDDLPEQIRPIRDAQFFAGQQQLPRSGRQSQRVIVDGFPSGLPAGTPEGVKIALASTLPPEDMPPIPGEAGVDYPVFTTVPDTGFDCNSQQYLPGIYGDTGADCQVFFMCQADGNFNSFLCPNGTVFNQEYFICDWWYNVDCSASQNFYSLNEFLYQDQPNGGFQQQFNGGDNFVDGSRNADNFVGGSFGGNVGNTGSATNLGNGNGNNFKIQGRGEGKRKKGNRNNQGGGSKRNNNQGGRRNNNQGGRRNNNQNNNAVASLPSYGVPQAPALG